MYSIRFGVFYVLVSCVNFLPIVIDNLFLHCVFCVLVSCVNLLPVVIDHLFLHCYRCTGMTAARVF